MSCEHQSRALCDVEMSSGTPSNSSLHQVVPMILTETSGTDRNHSSRRSSAAMDVCRGAAKRGVPRNILRSVTKQAESSNWLQDRSKYQYWYYPEQPTHDVES